MGYHVRLTDPWSAFERSLKQQLLQLEVHDFLILSAARGYVQFMRETDGRLLGECRGPRDEYGIARYQQDELRMIGSPGWPDYRFAAGPNFQRWWGTKSSVDAEPAWPFDASDVGAAAALAVGTLIAIFGAAMPDDVRLEQSRSL